MAITQAEVMNLFTQIAAIKNSDQILMLTANTDGSTSPTKITAELLRAYLNAGFSITIGDDGYIYIGGERTDTMATACSMIAQTDTTMDISPNVLNVWGEVSSLTLGFTEGSSGQENEYKIQFTCPSNAATTLTLPATVVWVEEPEFEAGYTYQISVVNNLAVYAGWEA